MLVPLLAVEGVRVVLAAEVGHGFLSGLHIYTLMEVTHSSEIDI